jgi:hypothetical protein
MRLGRSSIGREVESRAASLCCLAAVGWVEESAVGRT